MKNISLKDSIEFRRSYYKLSNQSPVSDEEIQQILEHILTYAPSPMNSQSPRMVLLLAEQHKKVWEITKQELKKVAVSDEAWKKTEEKVNSSFLSGYGTVLFYEDMTVIEGLQEKYPLYKDNFSKWSEHASAIVQILVWMALENEGFGASLQHYNPLIDKAIEAEWNIDKNWRLIAQMPFGIPTSEPGEKGNEPLEKRLKVYR